MTNYTKEWIKWEGNERPVDENTLVDIELRRGGFSTKMRAGDLNWEQSLYSWRIVAYRISQQQKVYRLSEMWKVYWMSKAYNRIFLTDSFFLSKEEALEYVRTSDDSYSTPIAIVRADATEFTYGENL